jgi:hypothetical protein
MGFETNHSIGLFKGCCKAPACDIVKSFHQASDLGCHFDTIDRSTARFVVAQ